TPVDGDAADYPAAARCRRGLVSGKQRYPIPAIPLLGGNSVRLCSNRQIVALVLHPCDPCRPVMATKGRSVRKLLIAVVAALAWAVLATQSVAAQSAAEPTAPPVAGLVACSGVEVLQTIQAVECSTD